MNKTQAKKVRHQNRMRRVNEYSRRHLEWMAAMAETHRGATVGTITLVGDGTHETS